MWLAIGILTLSALAIASRVGWRRRMQVLEEQRGEAIRTKRKMEELVDSEGWRLLIEMANSQIAVRRNKVNLEATKEPLEENFMKGEAAGIETFIRIPKALIEEAKAIIEVANKQVGEADGASED